MGEGCVKAKEASETYCTHTGDREYGRKETYEEDRLLQCELLHSAFDNGRAESDDAGLHIHTRSSVKTHPPSIQMTVKTHHLDSTTERQLSLLTDESVSD